MAIYSDLYIMIILTKVTKSAAGSESNDIAYWLCHQTLLCIVQIN